MAASRTAIGGGGARRSRHADWRRRHPFRNSVQLSSEGGPRFAKQLLWHPAIDATHSLSSRPAMVVRQRAAADHHLRRQSGVGLARLDLPMKTSAGASPTGTGAGQRRRLWRHWAAGGFLAGCAGADEQSPDIFEFPLVDGDQVRHGRWPRHPDRRSAAHDDSNRLAAKLAPRQFSTLGCLQPRLSKPQSSKRGAAMP